jgi:hypothetical protein
MSIKDPNSWLNHYSVLRRKDRNNPTESLQEICGRNSLFNQRGTLFEFYRAATQSEAWEGDDPEEKSKMLFFYSTTLYLWEIACRIDEMIHTGELLFTYPQDRRDENDKWVGKGG